MGESQAHRLSANFVAEVSYIDDEIQLGALTNVPGRPHAVVRKDNKTYFLSDDRYLDAGANVESSEKLVIEDDIRQLRSWILHGMRKMSDGR